MSRVTGVQQQTGSVSSIGAALSLHYTQKTITAGSTNPPLQRPAESILYEDRVRQAVTHLHTANSFRADLHRFHPGKVPYTVKMLYADLKYLIFLVRKNMLPKREI